MKLLKIYELIRETRDELEYLVKPVVREDIRAQRDKLAQAMELLKEVE